MSTSIYPLSDSMMCDRLDRREDPVAWSAQADGGMVATAHYRATEAAVGVLAEGGNAVDAAVAASFALGVAEPAGSGLGGMAMMMIHLAAEERTLLLDGPCRAPRSATPEAVAAAPRKYGYKAVALPTQPAVAGYALRLFGTRGLAEVLAPAIALAEEGVMVTPMMAHHTQEYLNAIRRGGCGRFLLTDQGEAPVAGSLLRQPILARTLRHLAHAGVEDFYQGEIGSLIAADMAANGGFISREDLEEIPWPRELEPVSGRFGEWTVHTLPPPGGGVTLLEMLHLFEELANERFDPDSPEGALLFAAVIRRAREDRRRFRLGHHLGVPMRKLATPGYAREVAKSLKEQLSGGETSHLCVMDRWGNIVSMTQSIERSFGSKEAGAELGFLYNGYMKGFKIESKNHPHYLRPGAVARSNAAPTIALSSTGAKLAIGSTGSERMLSGIFQVMARMRSQSPFEAVAAPRLHCTPEGEVMLEAARFSLEAYSALERAGYRRTALDPWSFAMGGLQLSLFEDGHYRGVAEPRRDGAALGISVGSG